MSYIVIHLVSLLFQAHNHNHNHKPQPQPQPTTTTTIAQCLQQFGPSPTCKCIKTKIHKGEFVQLGSLIQPPGTAPPSMSFTLVHNMDKVILCQQPIKLPTIDTIEKWASAFLIYMSVYLEVHTTRAIEMLKYMDTVRLEARQFGGYGWDLWWAVSLKTCIKSDSIMGYN